MATTKTIKIQKNKILSYSINKTGFQTVNKSVLVTENMTINENMVNQSGSQILQLGDRLLGISTFFMYFTPSGTYDVDSLKFISGKQTIGTGLTNIQVVKSLWLAQIETALSVETPRGTSKNFVFTFNGSTWDLTGATTVSGISTSDLNNVYGITFTGTASSGNVITITETHYNKFACYVLDSNYRYNLNWGDIAFIEPYYNLGGGDFTTKCNESATYFFNKYKENLSTDVRYVYCKNLGNFILPNNIIINANVPNFNEMNTIFEQRVALDSFDPVIQSGGTSYNLTNWAFADNCAVTCNSFNSGGIIFMRSNHEWINQAWVTINALGTIPIFEVPVM